MPIPPALANLLLPPVSATTLLKIHTIFFGVLRIFNLVAIFHHPIQIRYFRDVIAIIKWAETVYLSDTSQIQRTISLKLLANVYN